MASTTLGFMLFLRIYGRLASMALVANGPLCPVCVHVCMQSEHTILRKNKRLACLTVDVITTQPCTCRKLHLRDAVQRRL
jgi:hypothetical protein